MSRIFFAAALSATLVGISGCTNCCRRPASTRTTVVPGNPCPPGGGGFVPPPPPAPVAPFPGNTTTPPPSITPVPGNVPPPPPPPPAPGTVKYTPPMETNWQPVDGKAEPPRVALAVPELTIPGQNPGSFSPKLYPPVGEPEKKIATLQPPVVAEKLSPPTPEPPLIKEGKGRAALPVGIPQFAKAFDGVTGGLRPSIDDGLDWLAAKGYRTVVHLRKPGEPESPDRKQVEKLGMTYLSIEVAPQTFDRAKFDEFKNVVRAVARRPLFVYDQDGSLAGPLWYLYFRTVDNQNDDVARLKANTLGLHEDRDGDHRLMWLAAQKYLEANP